MLIKWGLVMAHFQVSVGHFFLGKPDVCFKLGHMSYLFNMWTKKEVKQLTTKQVIEKCMRLFEIKEHYQHQNLDPPQELLADLQLF